MIKLRYGYIANLICCLIISIVIGAAFSALTSPSILQDVTYSNNVGITYEYIKASGSMTISTFDEDGNPGTVHHIDKEEPRKIKEALITIPFIYSHRVAISFKPEENLIAIHKLTVNGEEIELKDITHIFSLSNGINAAYSKDYQALIIHNQLESNELSFDDNFNRLIRLTRSDMDDLENIFYISKKIYLILCCIVFAGLTIAVMNHLTRKKAIVLFYGFILLTAILGIAMAFIGVNYQNLKVLHDGDFWGNVLIVSQNTVPLAYTIVIFPLILVSLLQRNLLRWLLLLCSSLAMIILVLDNFFLVNIHTHFRFSESFDIISIVKYLPIFLSNYMTTSAAYYMLLAVILFSISCSVCWRRLITGSHITLVIAVVIEIFMIGWGFYPQAPFYEDYKLNNVFQDNGLSTSSKGNYNKAFKNKFEPRDNLDLKWKNLSGLNLKKNVILIVIESLDCTVTFTCGLEDNFLVNLEKLAKKGLSFDNYYSNAYNDAGAYISIIKSLPFLPNSKITNDQNNTKITKLYQENDLVNHINAAGYTSRFISSSPLLFKMKNFVDMSKWTQVITNEEKDFPESKNRYVFDSIPDEELYKKVEQLINEEKNNFFYYIKTSSTSTPNVTPNAKFNFEDAYRYADEKLGEFIENLEQNNFFKNGIVIITGDHKSWNNPKVFDAPENLMDPHKVPLIILNGDLEEKISHTYFSHSSLGVLIQSMILKEYRLNKFNADPLNSNKNEVVYHFEHEKPNFVLVSEGEKNTEILVNGNKSSFIEHVFPSTEEKDILGFLALCLD